MIYNLYQMKIIIILSCVFVVACAHQVRKQDNDNHVINQDSVKRFDYKKDSIMIYCDGIKQKLQLVFDRSGNNFYTDNSMLHRQMKCLSKAVNERNTNAINETLTILDNIKKINPLLSNNVDLNNDKEIGYNKHCVTKLILNQKWRGEEIFKKIIDMGNVHGCYREYGLNCGDLIKKEDRKNCYNIVSVHFPFFTAYTSMIRSIDGMSVEDYLQKKISHTIEIQLQREKDKCQESLYREYYIVIKEAYEKGLVVLKEYGEDD